MVYTGTFCTEEEIQDVEGANVSSAVDEAFHNRQVAQAESLINARTRVNWHDIYGTLDADTKQILAEVAASIAGSKGISYDMSGYSSRAEAETMLDLNNNVINRGLQILKEQAVKDFIKP